MHNGMAELAADRPSVSTRLRRDSLAQGASLPPLGPFQGSTSKPVVYGPPQGLVKVNGADSDTKIGPRFVGKTVNRLAVRSSGPGARLFRIQLAKRREDANLTMICKTDRP